MEGHRIHLHQSCATFFLLALVIHSDRENARKNAEESTRIIAQLIADQTEKNIRSIE
jgi:hypothetical protein